MMPRIKRLAINGLVVKDSTRHGHDAEQRAKHTGEGEQNHHSTLTPYQRVQFDAHRRDESLLLKCGDMKIYGIGTSYNIPTKSMQILGEKLGKALCEKSTS